MGRSQRLKVLKVTLCVLLVCAVLVYLYTAFASNGSEHDRVYAHGLDGLADLAERSSKWKAQTATAFEELGDVPLDDGIDVAMIFTKANGSLTLQRKFQLCVSSMLEFATRNINLHVIGDYYSLVQSKNIIEAERERTNGSAAVNIRVMVYDAAAVESRTEPFIRAMKRHFIYKQGTYYSDALFFFSIAMHRVFSLNRVVMLDVDLRFRADVAQLHAHFDRFDANHVIGLAREQQPVYRHIFHLFRRDHPDTDVGEPPPQGRTGFNSAVLLLDLQKMRDSAEYGQALNASLVADLVGRYGFQGHLGDQDFFTLVSLEFSSMFYVLPCNWNRQLCQWWRDHGYEDVFDAYHACDGDIKILHGNCNTPIPED